MIMDSAKYTSWIISFKKISMVRDKIVFHECLLNLNDKLHAIKSLLVKVINFIIHLDLFNPILKLFDLSHHTVRSW